MHGCNIKSGDIVPRVDGALPHPDSIIIKPTLNTVWLTDIFYDVSVNGLIDNLAFSAGGGCSSFCHLQRHGGAVAFLLRQLVRVL